MKREDCEKLLAAYRESVIAGNSQAAQPLFEVIVNIMADEEKPVYRGGITTAKEAPLPYRPYTIPMDFLKPIAGDDGRGEITATTATCGNSKEDQCN